MHTTPKVVGFRAWTLRTGHYWGLRDVHMEPCTTYQQARDWIEAKRIRCPWYQDFAGCSVPVYAAVST
jgi:hypothetical protein